MLVDYLSLQETVQRKVEASVSAEVKTVVCNCRTPFCCVLPMQELWADMTEMECEQPRHQAVASPSWLTRCRVVSVRQFSLESGRAESLEAAITLTENCSPHTVERRADLRDASIVHVFFFFCAFFVVFFFFMLLRKLARSHRCESERLTLLLASKRRLLWLYRHVLHCVLDG